jgi:tRNA (guanine-N7-)-methyltransferase
MARGRQIVRLKFKEPTAAMRAKYLDEWSARALYEGRREYAELSSPGLFRDERPLEVEIGPGTGEYICALATERPGHNFLGVEASRRSVYYAVRLASEAKLENIRFLRANVKLLYDLIPGESWDRVYLHFPDPVHKRSDEKHRVFDGEFLDVMARALTPQGQISVVSDKVDFFEEMRELAAGDRRFAFAHEEPYLGDFKLIAKSRFQRFWERKGVQARRFVIRRAG